MQENSDKHKREKSSEGAMNFRRDIVDNPFIRAEHEDDDGYDPYSDRIPVQPLFEKDPWK